MSSDITGATYTVAAPGTIAIVGSGAAGSGCWIEVKQGSQSGPITYTGIVHSGETHPISGAVWLELGNPGAVTVTVNGQTLTPNPESVTHGQPYNLVFGPA